MIRFFILLFFITALSFLQAYGVTLFDARPNLALAAIAASSFFITKRTFRIIAILLAVFILKSAPSDVELMVSLSVVFFVVSESVRTFRIHETVLIPLAAILGSLVLYLILAPSLIFSYIFVKEIFINAALALCFYFALSPIFSVKELKIRGE